MSKRTSPHCSADKDLWFDIYRRSLYELPIVMESTAASNQILDDSDYNDSEGYSLDEEQGYPEDTTLLVYMLGLYQVCC